jgi:tetratricopeptide (TPR) repeat protein
MIQIAIQKEDVQKLEYVFISFALLTLIFVALIALRDWVYHARISTYTLQKSLKKISQAISLQDWDKAEKELAILLQNNKSNKETALLQVKVLRGTGKLQEALALIEAKSKDYQEELLFRLEQGLIFLELKKPKQALEAFKECLPILRSESDLLSYAFALHLAGCPKQCCEVLHPLLQSTRNAQVWTLAGDALHELKFFQEAIEAYNRAIKLGNASHHLCMQQGHAYRRLGNLAEAEKLFRKLLEKNPADAAAVLGIGACFQERGNYNKAFFMYQAALALEKDIQLIQKAGYAALKCKKYRIAENYFKEILEQHQPEPLTLSYYGFCLENQRKWQEAEQTYLKLIQLFPSFPQGYRAAAWMFGVGLSQTISHEQGLNFAHRALKLKNDVVSWEILSAVCARNGNFEKAYQIQLALTKQDVDSQTKTRRQQALRKLRKKMPLDDHQVLRSQVA